MHQFRDKSVAQRELVSAGLLFYPVLQAADVLAYRAHEVPVGDDQREHVELMRDVARRFNARFGDGREVLVVPEHRIPEVGARIMDLQEPTRKMSTTGGSERGHRVRAGRARARSRRSSAAPSPTPAARSAARPTSPGSPTCWRSSRLPAGPTPEAVEADLAGARGYGDLKAAVAEAVVAMLAPVRARYLELRSDEAALEAVLAQGAARARELAAATLLDVRECMGVGAPRPV